MRGIQRTLSSLESLGILPIAISADSPEESRALIQKAGLTFPLLSDGKAETIRRYDLLHPKAGPDEHDIARPAEFLLDSRGTVCWVNLTENYWVRATPEQMLEATKLVR